MKKLIAPVVAMLVVVTCSFASAKETKSGLQVGDKAPAFIVNDCTGPSAGKSLCYRCKFGGRPVVNIFAREMSDEVVDLIKQIDQKVNDNKKSKMAAFVVHLTNNTSKSEATLKKVAQKNNISKKTPLTNYKGNSGPSSYKIAKEADVTVMMWAKGRVKVNYALKKGELSQETIKKIVNDTDKILK